MAAQGDVLHQGGLGDALGAADPEGLTFGPGDLVAVAPEGHEVVGAVEDEGAGGHEPVGGVDGGGAGFDLRFDEGEVLAVEADLEVGDGPVAVVGGHAISLHSRHGRQNRATKMVSVGSAWACRSPCSSRRRNASALA